MIKESLIDLLASRKINQKDKILLILATHDGMPINALKIQEFGIAHGLYAISRWNLSVLLEKANGLAVWVPDGWQLTRSGSTYIKNKYLDGEAAFTQASASKLQKLLGGIASVKTREYVEETIKCLDVKLYRSAVVMSWIGAMSVLYDYIVSDEKRLQSFNNRVKAIHKDWKPAVNQDDLAMLKDAEFLDTLVYLSVIGKSAKDELKNCLQRRNACGHPNSEKIGEHMAVAHIEFLIQNIYEKF